MKNLTTTAAIESFIAEHYESDYRGCTSQGACATVTHELLDDTDSVVDFRLAILTAWDYVCDRLTMCELTDSNRIYSTM